MSILDQDYDKFYAELDAREAAGIAPCEICGKPTKLYGDANYCPQCQARVDLEEQEADTVRALPILQPITERPVELNAKLWAEWKSMAANIQEYGDETY
jgi:hypothetical protein